MKYCFVKYGLGYLLAVFVAVCVAEAILIAPSVLPDKGRFGSFDIHMRDMPDLFVVGFIYTFGTALPGFAGTLYLAHQQQDHSRKFYCIGGALTALLAHVILAAAMGGFVMTAYIIFICSVPGGIAGAFAYAMWEERIASIWPANTDTTVA